MANYVQPDPPEQVYVLAVNRNAKNRDRAPLMLVYEVSYLD